LKVQKFIYSPKPISNFEAQKFIAQYAHQST
jgi:hypothetical protein